MGTGPGLLGAQQPLAAAGPAGTAATSALVLDGITVVDVIQGRLLPARRVVVVGSRIQAVGTAHTVALPVGAQVVDAHGQYVIPGLWDMHVHLVGDYEATARRETLYVAAGVTGMRTAGDRIPLDTLTRWRREILAGARVGPPRQLLAGMAVYDKYPAAGVCNRSETHIACVTDTADARRLVDSLAAAGADIIKPYSLARELYVAVAAAARRHRLPFGGHAYGDLVPAEEWKTLFANEEIDFAHEITPREASRLGARIVDHRWGEAGCEVLPLRKWDGWLGESIGKEASTWLVALRRIRQAAHAPKWSYCLKSARQFRRNGTWFVPTLVNGAPLFAEGVSPDDKARLNGRVKAFEQAGGRLRGNWLRDSVPATGMGQAAHAVPGTPRDAVLSLAERTGLPLLAGTDVLRDGFEGAFAIHIELALMVAEGLSPLHALQSATLNPALMLQATDSLGAVAPGKLADLVVLDANPLEDITNTTAIRAVVANGRYFGRDTLDALLAH